MTLKEKKIKNSDFVFTSFGTSSALPIYNRNQACHLLKINGKFLLIDCGEGAQISLRNFKVNVHKIEHIFISHLHGDHFLGLIGLLSSMNLEGRTKKITIYSVPELQQILELHFKLSSTQINYPLEFVHLTSDDKKIILKTDLLTVYAFPLNHRITCYGFLFEEKLQPFYNLKKGKIDNTFSVSVISELKQGNDVFDENGKLIYKASDFIIEKPFQKSFAYCSDTAPFNNLSNFINNTTYLYHETTFLDKHKKRASDTFHSTTVEAAELAKKINAQKLIIGHFSARYKSIEDFYNECIQIFPSTILAVEGNPIYL